MDRPHRRGPWIDVAARLPCAGLFACCATLAAPVSVEEMGSHAWREVDCSEFALADAPDHVACGFASVPRRHAEPDGARIELAAVVMRSTAAEPHADPLFIAQGGPGGSTIDTFGEWLVAEGPGRLATTRDLVLWDQRGTLWSKPALMCPEVEAAALAASLAETPPDEHDTAEKQAMRACGARLAGEAGDLSDFNTVENAHDVAALAAVLGYESINFYGVSYGTELGQYLIRQHPQLLRSVVLDAVVPTGFNLVTEVAFVEQRIAEKYLEGCAQQRACGTSYPDLAGRFQAVLDHLDAQPAVVEVTDPRDPDGAAFRIRITGEDLGGLLYQALYSREFQAVIPLLVDRATRGDIDFLAGTLLPMVLFDDTFALGMQVAVICAARGDTRLEDTNYAGINPRIARSERESAKALLEACQDWGIRLLPREVLEPVSGDVPVLLLSGNFDPITPPAFATRVGQTLSADFHVIFPRGTHGQAFSDGCANSIIEAFLDDPRTAPPADCAREAPIAYLVPKDLILLPALHDVIAAPEDERLAQATRFSAPILLGMLVLATALFVYPVGWTIERLRGHGTTASAAPAHWLDRQAGRIAILTLALFAAFFWLLARAIADSLHVSPAMLYLAAMRSEHAWIFAFALAGLLAIVLMAAALAAVWARGRRTLAGRLYYGLLLLAAIGVAAGLWRAGLFWPAEFI